MRATWEFRGIGRDLLELLGAAPERVDVVVVVPLGGRHVLNIWVLYGSTTGLGLAHQFHAPLLLGLWSLRARRR